MAGTVVLTRHHKSGGEIKMLEYLCTGDASNGGFPATQIESINGELLALETDPGATAPTDNYDITLADGTTGIDVLAGVGANRATATTEKVAIVLTGSVPAPVVSTDVLNLTIVNNSVNSAIITVKIYYRGK